MYFEEKMPENFTIRELDLFCELITIFVSIADIV